MYPGEYSFLSSVVMLSHCFVRVFFFANFTNCCRIGNLMVMYSFGKPSKTVHQISLL